MLDGDREQTLVEASQSITKVISDTADSILKGLSGGPIKYKPKVIDNLVVFVGATGGAGTSTIVANLAYTIKKLGLTVLVIDLNILYPIQYSYLGIKQALDRPDLVSFLLGRNSLGESIVTKGDISLLSSNNRNIMDYISCDTEECSKTFSEAIERLRLLFDLIIVDCPVNLEMDIVNTMLYRADSIYTVWDENIACISNVDKIRQNMELSGIGYFNKMKVVFNKRTSIHYSKYPFDQLGLEVIAMFPFDISIIESGLRGEVFCAKGASMSRNARFYVDEMGRLATKVLEIGGYKQ